MGALRAAVVRARARVRRRWRAGRAGAVRRWRRAVVLAACRVASAGHRRRAAAAVRRERRAARRPGLARRDGGRRPRLPVPGVWSSGSRWHGLHQRRARHVRPDVARRRRSRWVGARRCCVLASRPGLAAPLDQPGGPEPRRARRRGSLVVPACCCCGRCSPGRRRWPAPPSRTRPARSPGSPAHGPGRPASPVAAWLAASVGLLAAAALLPRPTRGGGCRGLVPLGRRHGRVRARLAVRSRGLAVPADRARAAACCCAPRVVATTPREPAGGAAAARLTPRRRRDARVRGRRGALLRRLRPRLPERVGAGRGRGRRRRWSRAAAVPPAGRPVGPGPGPRGGGRWRSPLVAALRVMRRWPVAGAGRGRRPAAAAGRRLQHPDGLRP